MSVTTKPQAARQVEARSRARSLKVRVQVITPGRHYVTRSQNDPSISYRLDRTSTGWTCECQGFRFTGMCKHIAQVERRSEREGWNFGKVSRMETTTPVAEPVRIDQARAAIAERGRAALAWLNDEDNDLPAGW